MSHAEQLTAAASQIATVNEVLRFSGPVVNPLDGSRPLRPEIEMRGWKPAPDWLTVSAAGPEEDFRWPIAGVELPRELLASQAEHYRPHKIVLEGRRSMPPLLGRLVLLNGEHDLRAARVAAHHEGAYQQYVAFDPGIEEVRIIVQWSQSETPLDPDSYQISEIYPVRSHVLRSLKSLTLPGDPSETPGTVK